MTARLIVGFFECSGKTLKGWSFWVLGIALHLPSQRFKSDLDWESGVVLIYYYLCTKHTWYPPENQTRPERKKKKKK
ncbi:hypothetical protein VTN49DRAFT_611 [Thermomyces lanuginosus]|uniref:uncharacterized protein n=1 Tax=Thermomyces lanuginosus TaxID=5541 RepID=UPI0037446B91